MHSQLSEEPQQFHQPNNCNLNNFNNLFNIFDRNPRKKKLKNKPRKKKKKLNSERVGTLAAFIGIDIFYANFRNNKNEASLRHAFHGDTLPKIKEDAIPLIPRESLTKEVEGILKPSKYYSFYHIIVGEDGTGKTTLVKRATNNVKKGVIYVMIPDQLSKFGDEFAKAIGWSLEEKHTTVLRKIFTPNKSQDPKLDRAMDAFMRGAAYYKKMYGTPLVLILDNIDILAKKDPDTLQVLQDQAKSNADLLNYITVFVSSEGIVPRMMMTQSSWSRAGTPMVIGDLTEDEALRYLNAKLGIEEIPAEYDMRRIMQLFLRIGFYTTCYYSQIRKG